MHPTPVGLTTSHILLAIVVLRWTAAIVPATCSSSGYLQYISIFPPPSFNKYDVPKMDLSWDAGFFDGSLHLTGDDVYQLPIEYPPDGKTSAGTALFRPYSYRRYLPYSHSWEVNQPRGFVPGTSFNISFTMSVSRSRNHTAAKQDDGGLLFEVVPSEHTEFIRTSYFSLANSKHGNISIEIGKLEYYYEQGTTGLYVSVSPAPTPNATAPAKSAVWIDYDAVGHNLSVYVDADGKPKPGQATLHTPLNICDIVSSSLQETEIIKFGFFASKNRLLPSCRPVVYSWNLTIGMPSRPTATPVSTGSHQDRHGSKWLLVLVVLFTVLAAAAAVVATVFVATPCLTSRYRALKMKLKLSRVLRRLPGMPREFKYADVKKATRNFHESMRLGRGGFGAVYKGKISATRSGEDGGRRQRRRRRRHVVEVAVKKFTRMEDRSYDDFLAEVAVINRLRHRNVVPLIGWCYENGELLLIYQYMPNGSLDQHLFCKNGHDQQHIPTLRWKTRYHIVAGVVAALHYIHHEYEHVVLHRDIKSSNIMLDADFNGRLGDFGLARVVGFDKNSFTDFDVAGTWGFIAPEYPVSHKATRQTDVYALGVLILEVVTGKRSLGAASDEFPVLADWVWWLHGQGRLLEAVDDKLTAAASEFNDADDATGLLEDVEMGNDRSNTAGEGGEFNAADATRLLLLGLACSNPNPGDRPSMADVAQVIARMVPPPDVPQGKPTFAWPPDGELPLLDDSDDDDFVGMIYDDEPDQRHRWEERKGRDGLALSIGSFEITLSRFRDVGETSLGRPI